MNPCHCGFHGDRQKECICSGEQISRYRVKVSGPLLDRIDLFVEVNRPQRMILPGKERAGESNTSVRKRVTAARKIQIHRQNTLNANIDSCAIMEHCRLEQKDESFLEQAAIKLSFSPRACQRVLKVARTIADLEGTHDIKQVQLAEAIAYRQ